MENNKHVRLLSEDELSELNTKDYIKITIDLGTRVDSNNRVSQATMLTIIDNLKKEYQGTSIYSMLNDISQVQKIRVNSIVEELIEPKLEFIVSTCGGCGCNPNPKKWCYVIQGGCLTCN